MAKSKLIGGMQYESVEEKNKRQKNRYRDSHGRYAIRIQKPIPEKNVIRVRTVQRSNDGRTANNAVTHQTSGVKLVDFFGSIGALRGASEKDILSGFYAAFFENKLLAIKTLFYGRDIRQGAGERKVFRIIIKSLADRRVTTIYKNLHLIPFYGRWDDMFCMLGINYYLDQKIFKMIRDGITDHKQRELIAKWLPREKSSQKHLAKIIARGLQLSLRDYRKMLAKNTDVIETVMSNGYWSKIKFEHLPSRAIFKYRKAFERNCSREYQAFLGLVKIGVKKIHSATLYPYDLVRPFIQVDGWGNNFVFVNKSRTEINSLTAQWDALPNYMKDSKERLLPVVDVSGSMGNMYGGLTVMPMTVSVSLGIYIAERNKSIFKNQVVTFSEKPSMIEIPSNCDLGVKVKAFDHMSWDCSTNIESVMNLMVNSAVRHNVRQSSMPTIILIISDMQFNSCTSNVTASQATKDKFRKAGYAVPKIIFWQVNASLKKNSPVKFDERGVAIVSGCSPSILKSILGMRNIAPFDLMIKTLDSPRYTGITI